MTVNRFWSVVLLALAICVPTHAADAGERKYIRKGMAKGRWC